MNIQKTTNNIFKNRHVLKSLEFISAHGVSVAAGTSLFMSTVVRPIAILATPDVEKENKQYACANSIGSGLIKFGIVAAVSLPIENAIKKIDIDAAKYYKKQAVNSLSELTNNVFDKKGYAFATQIIKLSTGLITAVPKSMLTIALIPVLMDKLFNVRKKSQVKKDNAINFKGGSSGFISRVLSGILQNESFQKFVNKYKSNDKNIAKHMSAATDILLSSSFAIQTNKSKKIKENRKKALIYNNVISTAITLLGGYGVDRIIKAKTDKFIEKFSKINADDAKLGKYIEGINILRPAIIFAAIYYGVLPMFSTYIAEKIDKYINKNY